MPDITYDNIKPLLVRAEPQASSMRCTFRCPVTGQSYEGSASIQQGQRLGDVAKQSIKRSLMWRVRYGISSLLYSVLGYSMLGRVGADVASSVMNRTPMGSMTPSYSDAEKQAAVVQAFRSIASRFTWDSKNHRWMSSAAAKDTMPEFLSQLQTAPVVQRYDLAILARMLVDVARVDGQLSPEEQTFFEEFVPSDLANLQDLLARPWLTAAELQGISAVPVRETMLMISWALACADQNLAQPEQQLLTGVAAAMQIAPARAEQLRRMAQGFVFDQALEYSYASGQFNPAGQQEAFQFAQRIGLDRGEAERLDVRYRKRNGIV